MPAMSTWTHAFLEALRDCGVVAEACRRAMVSSATVYARRREDADFAAQWDNALEDATDAMELEARRRAIHGIEEPVIHKGELTPVWERDEHGQVIHDHVPRRVWRAHPEGPGGAFVDELHPVPRQARNEDGTLRWLTVRKPSDPMLMFLLKGNRAKFSTERTEITGKDGAPLQVADATKRAGRIAALLELARRRKDVDDLL
jgi:hypothetical protein